VVGVSFFFFTLVDGGVGFSTGSGDDHIDDLGSGVVSGVASVVVGAFSSSDSPDGCVDASCANAGVPQINPVAAKSEVINFI